MDKRTVKRITSSARESTHVLRGLPGPLFVIAHNIRSIYNVGSIFRNADAFAVDKVYLTGYTGTPEHPKLAKVALGAQDHVDWEKRRSATWVIKKLRREYPNLKVVALENNINFKTIALPKYQPKFPLALLLGEETKGQTKNLLNLADDIIEIPMHGHKESLNVSVAAGIALYQLTRNYA